MRLGKAGIIGRWKPLHNGGALLLDNLCEQADEVIIGIGSSNKYNARSPFTSAETKDMLEAYLRPRHDNYTIVEVPDFGHIPKYKDGQKWRSYVKEHFGRLDHFITGNDYVKDLLKDDYHIIEGYTLTPKEDHVYISGSIVRQAMARNDRWERLVPQEVSQYLIAHGFVDRFRKEFGLETLVQLADYNAEKAHHKREEQEKVWTQ